MKTYSGIVQGSKEWLKLRAGFFTASEASAMMGCSTYMTRNDLLDLKKSGIAKEVDSRTQELFDRGHETEELARKIIEERFNEEFYTVTGSIEIDGIKLLASFDGINMTETVVFEHKLYNETLALATEKNDLPASHYWQLEQQLLVSGAEKVLFVVSDGTKDKMKICEYFSVPKRRERLILGWQQFSMFLETHKIEPKEVKVIADPVMQLPALSIQVGGSISIQSNLVKFGERLKSFIEETNTKPETDLDFVNMERACKVLKEAEDALKQAETNALAQTSSVDEMHRTVAYLADIARTNRLQFEKLVKVEKENRKNGIVQAANKAISLHHAELQKEIEGVIIPFSSVSFADAIKGKKTLSSMQDAVDTMLLDAKLDSDALAKDIRARLAWYKEKAKGYEFLFHDLQNIIQNDGFKLNVHLRIVIHKDNDKIKEIQLERDRVERESRLIKEAEEPEACFEREEILAIPKVITLDLEIYIDYLISEVNSGEVRLKTALLAAYEYGKQEHDFI